MDNHSDVRQAPRAGVADRRQGRIIAKIIGTLALVSFMLVATASTARALGIGEIVDESPLGPVTETAEEITDPVTDVIEQPVNQTVEPVAEAVEPVAEAVEPITEVVGPAVDTVQEATEPITEVVGPAVDTIQEATEPVTEVVGPAVSTVQEATEPATEAVGPAVSTVEEVTESVTESVEGVVGSVTETIEGPVSGVTGTVGHVLEEVQEPIQPVIDVVDDTIGATTEVVGGVTTPVLDTVDDLIDPVLPLIPDTDDLTDVGGDAENGASISDPAPVRGPDSGDTPSNSPGSRTNAPDKRLAQPVPVPSLLTTPSPAFGAGQARDEGGATRESPPTSNFMADAVRGGDSPGGVGPSEGAGPAPRSVVLPSATGSSSGSGPAASLLAVLVLLGLIAPRLSRWLRPRPVIWRPYALAQALELPG
jgi:hypothetical protein